MSNENTLYTGAARFLYFLWEAIVEDLLLKCLNSYKVLMDYRYHYVVLAQQLWMC